MTAPAETLRAAVTRLRCEHLHPVQPPEGSLAKPGDCRMCGAPFNPEFVNGIERVAEPLADWLEDEANWWDHHGGLDPDSDHPALTLARAILGRTS